MSYPKSEMAGGAPVGPAPVVAQPTPGIVTYLLTMYMYMYDTFFLTNIHQ